jgi:hypothetical protein
MLLNELKCKGSELSRLYHLRRNFKTLIDQDLNILHIARINRIISKIITDKEKTVKETHLKKLNVLRETQQSNIRSDKLDNSPITNISKRILTEDEIDLLEKGLNFVFPSKKFDELSFISNIETYFVNLLGHCTDKKDYDVKDEDEQISYNLTPDQLRYANKLRSICNQFRSKTDKVINKHKFEILKFEKIMKNLSKDKSIKIIKPDKGKGIVIIDKIDYDNKMIDILKDNNIFKISEVDETLINEDRLLKN